MVAIGCLQSNGVIILALHLLHNAIHPEIVTHVQGLDVRNSRQRRQSFANHTCMGCCHENSVQLEYTGSVQFSRFTAKITVTKCPGNHTKGMHNFSVNIQIEY